MLRVRQTRSGSWLDAESVHYNGYALSRRLRDRCEGHAGLFVTLTYRPGDFESSRDLYRKCSHEQHIPLFLRKLSRYLGQDLRGRWLAKMEFQQNGYIHFHIIVLDVPRIPHGEVSRLWGKGFVWLSKLSPSNLHYMCKYAAKGGSFPSWVLLERPKSVKIIRTSRGFWRNPPATQTDTHPILNKTIPVYVPIGEKLERREKTCAVMDDALRVRTYRISLADLLTVAAHTGVTVKRDEFGWMEFHSHDFAAFDGMIRRGRARVSETAPGLHLMKCRKHDAGLGAYLIRHVFESYTDYRKAPNGILRHQGPPVHQQERRSRSDLHRSNPQAFPPVRRSHHVRGVEER